jgi:bacillithiol system protein YtxJ
MGFLDNLRRASEAGAPPAWQALTDLGQLDRLQEASQHKPVAIFKHSTTCGISAMAKHTLESGWDFGPEELDAYYLDLLAYRPVSNAVAERWGITHQSPQMILIYRGKAVYAASHQAVSAPSLRKALEKALASA